MPREEWVVADGDDVGAPRLPRDRQQSFKIFPRRPEGRRDDRARQSAEQSVQNNAMSTLQVRRRHERVETTSIRRRVQARALARKQARRVAQI